MSKRRVDLTKDLQHPDFDLVLDYATKVLDRERVAEVQRRLRDEPEFRAFAAPLIAVWDLPFAQAAAPRLTREQLEKSWDRFTKRAGFVRQRRAALQRRLWIFGIT